MIKILIKSEYINGFFNYYLMLEKKQIIWELYHYKIHDIYKRIIGCSMDSRRYYNDIDEDFELTTEYELSGSFCILANRAYNYQLFEIGNSDECIYPFENSLDLFSESKIPMFYPSQYFKSNSVEEQYICDLKSMCTQFNIREWCNVKDTKMLSANNAAYNLYAKLNLYRYSKFIEYLIEKNTIELDSYIPIVNGYEIFKLNKFFNADDIYFCSNTISFFSCDIYPLDLAVQSCNYSLLKSLLLKGATKYIANRNVEIDFISLILNSAKSNDDIELAESFILNSKFITPLFDIKKQDYGDGYSWREYLDSDGEKILLLLYSSFIRIGDIEHLKILIEKYPKQIFCCLKNKNLYNAKVIGYGSEKEIEVLPEMANFIETIVAPQIDNYEFASQSYKDYGIWGFDARTGRPIKM